MVATGADELERLADLAERDPVLAESFAAVRKLGRLMPPESKARALRERATVLRGRVHDDVGRRRG